MKLWWRTLRSRGLSLWHVMWPYQMFNTCVDIVHTRPSLPILKYSSTLMHVFEYKTTHIERQRVLPAFAYTLVCLWLQSTSRPHSFMITSIQNSVKKRTGRAELLAPRPGHLVQTAGNQIQSVPHKGIWDEMLSSGMKCYHLDLMLSSGMKCYHLRWNVIIWS
jgi:hypothetical protein